MSNQIKGLVVTFKTPIHEDKAGRIQCLSDVAGVEECTDNFEDQMTRMQVRMDLERRLWEALK